MNFKPKKFLKNPHLQTFAAFMSPKSAILQPQQHLLVDVSDGDRLVMCCDYSDALVKEDSPILLLLHGLGGSSDGEYMKRISKKIHQQRPNFRVIRFNHRGCGNEGLKYAKGIYHSDRIDDIAQAILYCQRQWPNALINICGFSLSANMLLRLMGLRANSFAKQNIVKILAVCPPVDLEECSLAITRIDNFHLDQYYVAKLKKHFKKIDPVVAQQLQKFMKLRTLDSIATAPLAGFKSRDEYYRTSSSLMHIPQIKVPTLILASDDDPIIPNKVFANIQTMTAKKPDLRLIITRGGGHMGFIADQLTQFGDRYWMDDFVVRWACSELP